MRELILIIYLTLSIMANGHSQSPVAITIDDIPNTTKYKKDKFQIKLLNKLDSLSIPVAIFITEGLIYKTDSTTKNISSLTQWVERDYVLLGNHSFGHFHYSQLGIDSFNVEIEKGEYLTRQLARTFNKSLDYFRLPFNDLGKDSLQHMEIAHCLGTKNYIISPFTIESSDWIFNYLYEYYIENGQKDEAQRIADSYINTTLEYFDFFDSLAVCQYSRHINQIYLCHDNSLNADYLDILINRLKQKHYTFISLNMALEDNVYKQSDMYYKEWGVSWIYRWMRNHNERIKLMRQEPNMDEILKEYEDTNSHKII